MSRWIHRGVRAVLPEGDAIDRLVERVDPTRVSRRMLSGVGDAGRRGLRRLFVSIYEAGMRDGIDRAIELGSVEGLSPSEASAAPAVTPSPSSSSVSPVRAAIERYRTAKLPLPKLPETALSLNRLLADPDFDIGEVIDLIRRDPGLTAKVMRAAASSLYAGGGRQPRSLNDAVVRLGSRELSRFLMLECNQQLFTFKTARSEDALRSLWTHCLATGLAAEMIAAHVEGAHPATYFLHGLLHDIGRAVLLQVFDDMADEGPTYSEVEIARAIDGLHGQFGAALLKRWGFGASFTEVAMFHHQRHKAFGYGTLVTAVALADVLALKAGFINGETMDEATMRNIWEDGLVPEPVLEDILVRLPAVLEAMQGLG